MQGWLGVDPKAEAMMGYSPYNAMANNPVSFNDPEGDILPAIAVAAIIGAAAGGIGNTIYQATQGNINSWGDGFAAFGIGAVAGGVGAAAGSVAIMGSAAFATGAAAATATGVTVGGYTLGTTGFVSGALSGTVGAAISSPLRQVGNILAGWQDKFSVRDMLVETGLGFGIGGISGGLSAAFKGQNFWWVNSVKIVPGGNITAGLGRVVDPSTISDFATDNSIYAGQKGKLSSKIINDYYDRMAGNAFDPALKHNRIGGYVKNGKWFIGDGHHRVAAAIKYGMNTGDYRILTQMMNYGSFSTPPFTPTHIIFPKKWR